MHNVTAFRLWAALAFGLTLLGGCRKETPQKVETSRTLPAPQPAQTGQAPEQPQTGEVLFKQHCAVCHPDGGNVIKPEFALHRKALAAHDITRLEDIVKIMRNPGPGMTKFDEATIPDQDAMAIARYVLDTFE